MQNGANSVHKLLRTELEDYIKSQYFGKSPLLLSALSNHIDDEGLLYQKPFIESSPAYVTSYSWRRLVSGSFHLHLLIRFLRSKRQQKAKTYLYQQVLVPVKPSVLCGLFSQKWPPKLGTQRNHGQNEAFAQS